MKYFLLLILWIIGLIPAKRKDPKLSKWTVDISLTRQIKINIHITDKGKCDVQKKDQNDITMINARMKTDLFIGTDYTQDVQLSSDKDEEAKRNDHPLKISGTLTNNGNSSEISTCTCDCGDCSVRSDTKKRIWRRKSG